MIISIVIFTILIIVGQVKELVTSCTSPFSASEGSHAVVVCTEWDEFKTLNWKKVATMRMILTTIMIHDLENVKVIRIIMWCTCYNLNILPFWCNCFQHLKDVIMCHISPDIRGNDETGLCLWWWANSIYQIVFQTNFKTKLFHSEGRKILPHEELVKIGFSVETIGKQILQVLNLNATIVKLNYLQENRWRGLKCWIGGERHFEIKIW